MCDPSECGKVYPHPREDFTSHATCLQRYPGDVGAGQKVKVTVRVNDVPKDEELYVAVAADAGSAEGAKEIFTENDKRKSFVLTEEMLANEEVYGWVRDEKGGTRISIIMTCYK